MRGCFLLLLRKLQENLLLARHRFEESRANELLRLNGRARAVMMGPRKGGRSSGESCSVKAGNTSVLRNCGCTRAGAIAAVIHGATFRAETVVQVAAERGQWV